MTDNKERDNQNERANRARRAVGVLGLLSGGRWLWGILIFAAAVLAVLVLLGSMRRAGPADANKNFSTFTVRRDDLTITVTESGSIRARNQIDIKSGVEGRTTILSIVPEGTYITGEDVDNGKLLAQLDSSELEEQVAKDEIEFAAAEASYAEATEAYEIQVKQNESDITAAQLDVKFALMDFQKYLGETAAGKLVEEMKHATGPEMVKMASVSLSNPTDRIVSLLDDPNRLRGSSAWQQLQELNDQITLAESRLKRADYKLEGTQKLYDANYAAEIELMADQLEKKSCEIQKEQTERSLELFKRYEFPKQAEKLLSDYYEAQRELDRTLARARSRLAQADAQLKSAKARFELRQDRLNKLKEQIDACVIRAPAAGLVVYASSHDFYAGRGRGGSSSSTIEEGETVYQRQKIISLPDTSEMIAEIGVHESLVDMVRPGQRAKIIVDAFPDKTFQGEVLRVAPLPDPRRGWMNPDLKVYTTEVSIEGRYDFLKPGMSAKVEILVEQLHDVIIVPIQVVANRGGRKVCYCLTPQGPEEQEVRTGAFNDTFVQIIDGLQVGETVLLNPPRVTNASPVRSKSPAGAWTSKVAGAADKLKQRQRSNLDSRYQMPDTRRESGIGDRESGKSREGRGSDAEAGRSH